MTQLIVLVQMVFKRSKIIHFSEELIGRIYDRQNHHSFPRLKMMKIALDSINLKKKLLFTHLKMVGRQQQEIHPKNLEEEKILIFLDILIKKMLKIRKLVSFKHSKVFLTIQIMMMMEN